MEDRRKAIADLMSAVYTRIGEPRDFMEEAQRRAWALQSAFESSDDPPQLTEEFLRHWVAADVTAYRRSSAEVRKCIALNIAGSMKHSAYEKRLKSVDPQLARRAYEAAMQDAATLDALSIRSISPRDERLPSRAKLDSERQPDPPIGSLKSGQKDSQSLNGFLGSSQGVIEKLLASVTYEPQSDGTVKYSVRSKPSFVDHGNQILMIAKANEDKEAILAGLLLASEKYGGEFEITGSEEFKQRAIEIMVDYQLNPKLKNPAQETLFRELAKKQYNPQTPTPSIGAGAPPAPERSSATNQVRADRDSRTATASTVYPPVAVKAIDWWNTQRELIQSSGQNAADVQESLRNLGPKPPRNTTWWFQDGRPCPAPASVRRESAEFPQRFTSSAGDQQGYSQDGEGTIFPAQQGDPGSSLLSEGRYTRP